VGSFAEDAFYVTRDHYRVFYADGVRSPLSRDWFVENFQVRDGVPVRAKTTSRYFRPFDVDVDDDGIPDRRHRVELVDLRFQHATDGSVVWAQTTPVPSRRAHLSLDVVAHDFVDRVGGGSYFEVDWDSAVVRRVATQITREAAVTIDGVPGYMVTFDHVSLDQRELNQAAHRGERVTVVLVRPTARWRDPPTSYDGEPHGLHMLVVFGMATRAEFHDVHMEEFARFLGRVDFHETN
jgi:hypothetical protein